MNVEIPGVGVVAFPDGTPTEVIEKALAAYITETKPNPDGTYGTPPEGFVLNPTTGQMEDLRSPNNPNISTGLGNAIALGTGQGAMFDGFDETVAGIEAATGNDYGYELARAREADRRAQEEHPYAYYGTKVPVAIWSSLGLGKLLGINPQGATVLRTAGRGAGIGAYEGGLFGFLSGEGGLANRARSAIGSATLGAGIGGAAPIATNVAVKAGRGILDATVGNVQSLMGVAREGKANRLLAETVARSGRSLDDIADDVARAAQEGQPEFRTMDALGKAGQRRVSGIVRAGGDGAEEIASYLETRQLGQPERLGAFVDEAFGMGGKTAQQTDEALRASRRTAADKAFTKAAAKAGPVDVAPAVQMLDDTISQISGSGINPPRVVSEFINLRGKLAGEMKDGTKTTLSDYKSVLALWREVRDDVDKAYRTGDGALGEALKPVRDALEASLAAASSDFRAANAAYRKASGVIEAIGKGADMTRTTRRAADTTRQFSAMPAKQQAAARIGYGDSILSRIEAATAPTANRAKGLQSPKVATEIGAMSIDPGLLQRRLGRETAMWGTQNRALGGSMTADNIADQNSLGILADAGRIARDLTTGAGDGLLSIATRLGNAATGTNEATRQIVARALMSDDPKRALAAAMAQQATSEGRQRLADTIIRTLGREYLPTP